MDVAATGLPTAGSTSDAASKKLTENFDTFLQLLTTQLKNQDPLNPLDSKDFISQLVQFSEVEQSIQTNQSLGKLLDFQNTNQATAALGYIGNKVEVKGDTAPLENGTAEFSYTLPSNAASTLVVIRDANGQVVHSASGEVTAGKHSFVWDGTTNGGGTAPPGSYKITIAAQDADGAPITATTTVTGTVTGLESDDTGVQLSLGNSSVPIGSVLSVKGKSSGS